MTPEQEFAISNFFVAVDRLEQLDVIRSSRFLGDIGEFLCQAAFGIELASQLRQTGHDGMDGDERVQIKFNNSTAGNNINVGKPASYDALIVVIGPQSKLREPNHKANEFRLYRFASSEVELWKSTKNNYYCAKEKLIACGAKHSLITGSVETNAEE